MKSTLLVIWLCIVFCSAQNLRSEWDTQPDQLKPFALKSQNDLGAAFLGFIFGPIVFMLSFVIVWFNEKRAAINKTRLIKIRELLNNQQIPNSNVSSQNIGDKLIVNSDPNRLTYTSGPVLVQVPARDPASKLTGDKWLKLDRIVEVYEYRTVSNKKNQEPQLGWYSYHMSSAGNRTNDIANWFLKTQTFTASQATINEFKMNEKQMKSVMTNIKVQPTPEMAQAIKQTANRPKQSYLIQGDYLYFPGQGDIKLSPGTLRVKYSAYKPDVLSIISSYTDSKILQPFRIDHYQNKGNPDTLCCEGKSFCCACNAIGQAMKPISEVDIVMQGKKTQQQMIDTMISINGKTTNLLRIISYFIMVLGIYMFFSPLVQILGYIPLVGGFLKGVAGTLILLGAIIVCIPLFLLTFSLAWLVYHPKTGILFLLLAIIITVIVVVLNQVYQNK